MLLVGQAEANVQEAAVDGLALGVPRAGLHPEPAVVADLDAAVDFVLHHVAAAGQAVHEVELALEGHVVPGPGEGLLRLIQHAVIDALAGGFAARHPVLVDGHLVLGPADQHAEVIHQDALARGEFVGGEAEGAVLRADGNHGAVVACGVHRVGGHQHGGREAAFDAHGQFGERGAAGGGGGGFAQNGRLAVEALQADDVVRLDRGGRVGRLAETQVHADGTSRRGGEGVGGGDFGQGRGAQEAELERLAVGHAGSLEVLELGGVGLPEGDE